MSGMHGVTSDAMASNLSYEQPQSGKSRSDLRLQTDNSRFGHMRVNNLRLIKDRQIMRGRKIHVPKGECPCLVCMMENITKQSPKKGKDGERPGSNPECGHTLYGDIQGKMHVTGIGRQSHAFHGQDHKSGRAVVRTCEFKGQTQDVVMQMV